MWDRWVIDAEFGCKGGAFCFCPVDADGLVVVGMSYVSDRPPEGGRLVGVWHPDGREAAERFQDEHRAALEAMPP